MNNKGLFYTLPERYKYSAAFESKLVPLTEEDTNKFISLASQDNLKQYLPKNVDLGEKIDCLAIAGQSFVANKLNLNDDGVDTDTAIRIAKLFPLSYIDTEHKRDSIVGVILSASYSDADTNTPLTEDEVKSYNKPFSVTIGGIVWKLANKHITEALEDEKLKDSLFFSWELAFTEYKLMELPKDKFNFSEGKIVGSEYGMEQVKNLDKQLKANGGSGQLENGNKIGRIIMGDCIPLGVGIVEHPAGQLTPLIIDTKEEVKNTDSAVSFVVEEAIEMLESAAENFTNDKNGVKKNVQENQNKKLMDKITKISDITDENLAQCKASAIVDFINEGLQEADKKWKAEEELKKNALAEKEKAATELQKVQEDLKKLQEIQAAKEAEELFNQRMTYFDDVYELSKEERQTIAAEIKELDNDSFEKAKSKFEIFLKDKSKAAIQAKLEAEEIEAKKSGKVFDKEKKKWVNKEDVKEEEKKESKASLDENGTVIDEALANGKDANTALPNAQSGVETLESKYAEHFKPENCIEFSKRQ